MKNKRINTDLPLKFDVHSKETNKFQKNQLFLLDKIKENKEILKSLINQHVFSCNQFDRDILLQLFRLSILHELYPEKYVTILNDKILISAFYEPSTRTRLSFESCWNRLGGNVISITDVKTTGIGKGESYSDIATMMNNYGDCVVLRDADFSVIIKMMGVSNIPIINAGNGLYEHPTQALADLYAIFKWRPDLIEKEVENPIHLCLIGVPSRMRTVRSLLKLLANFPSAFNKITIIVNIHETNIFSDHQYEELTEKGLKIEVKNDLNTVLPKADLIYINTITWEDDSMKEYGANFKLSIESPLKKGAKIMHPLARKGELSIDLDHTSYNHYFVQAKGAVSVRCALLSCVMNAAF